MKAKRLGALFTFENDVDCWNLRRYISYCDTLHFGANIIDTGDDSDFREKIIGETRNRVDI